MSQHNGYKTLNEHSTLAQLHPSTAPLSTDEYGLTPDYLIYTSLVATARVFLSKVGNLLPLSILTTSPFAFWWSTYRCSISVQPGASCPSYVCSHQYAAHMFTIPSGTSLLAALQSVHTNVQFDT